jgi:hypothetical protein
MRIVWILISLVFSNSLFSQNELATQLQQIIGDTANHFQKFKGKLEEFAVPDSSHCYSNITLEGTKENTIYTNRTSCDYYADIVNSANKTEGKRTFAEWKSKLITVLGSAYKIEKYKSIDGKVDGWYFTRGNLYIAIYLRHSVWDKSLYVVSLSISYSVK